MDNGNVKAPAISTTQDGLIHDLCQVRQQKAALDRTEKLILGTLKPMVDPKFDALPDQPVVGDGFALTRIPGTTRTISAELLLERGVAPDVVNYATKTTAYFRYSVKELGRIDT